MLLHKQACTVYFVANEYERVRTCTQYVQVQSNDKFEIALNFRPGWQCGDAIDSSPSHSTHPPLNTATEDNEKHKQRLCMPYAHILNGLKLQQSFTALS